MISTHKQEVNLPGVFALEKGKKQVGDVMVCHGTNRTNSK